MPRCLLGTTLLSLAVACAVAGFGSPVAPAPAADPAQQKEEPQMDPIIHAPDFPKGFAWLNTEKPLSFEKDLKGQVVVLDFWTYCCINCMHVVPDLEYLEQKYKDQPVVIIGVHSAKYDNEEDAANIRAAAQRYEVHHPILVDEKHRVWDEYDVTAWPTIVVVGADARIIGGASGEGHRALLENVIDKALADGRAKGTLAKVPLKLAKEGQVRAASGLSFPGKVIADVVDGVGKRLFILDSNHNRIVIAGYPGDDGRAPVQQIIGTGKTGTTDGDFAAASFNRPQGATLVGNTLWVADTENHLIRRIDLEKKTVSTVLGTGKQVTDRDAGKSGRDQGLNSPWDVAIAGNRLYIAQAGQHQIFAMNLMTGMTEIAAGSGRENIRDGAFLEANLAQPSGMALDAKNQIVYFADSEVSAVRGLDIKDKSVFTVIGHGLFTFGDTDGDAEAARFQHPLGLTLAGDGQLLVADTYNHKIKIVDPDKATSRTLAGTGKSGTGTPGGNVQFFEPASVAVGAGRDIFVADTNNHRIVRLQRDGLASSAWKELMLIGLDQPGLAEVMADKDAKDAGTKAIAAGKPVSLKLTLSLPAGNHLTPGAPISVKITDGTTALFTGSLSAPALGGLVAATPELSMLIPADALAGKPAQLYVTAYYTHCTEGASSVCIPAKAAWKVSARYEGDAATLSIGP